MATGSDPLNATSVPEVCDGADNDLNDGIDEGFMDTDGDGLANCVDPDDDNDRFTDAEEVAAGSNPLDPRSVPPCRGDVNGDGKVNLKDLVLLAKALGTRPGQPRWNPAADLDRDGDVDLVDGAIALASSLDRRCPH
jgi:hypothetical protein